jgi:flagellar protein FliS
MIMNSTELAYRKTAVEGASGFGLLIALYDTLAGDLLRAADAERRNDLEKRCHEINHATLVIGYLEDWVERSGGGELAQQLAAFYSSLRRKMIEAQVARSAELLEEQVALVLKIRETWSAMERQESLPMDVPRGPQVPVYPGAERAVYEGNACSWSA